VFLTEYKTNQAPALIHIKPGLLQQICYIY